jgi:hypothetical protein
MSFTACGCGLSFKASGLRCHQRQSVDIRCQTEHTRAQIDTDCDTHEDMDIDPQSFVDEFLKNTSSSTRAEYAEFEVDPAGDFFGDYKDYFPEEFGMDYLDSNVSDNESECTIDEEEYILANNSELLEPERLPSLAPDSLVSSESPLPENLISDEAVEMDLTTAQNIQKASRLRGGAEEVLQKRPFAVKFTKGKAGAVYTNQHVDGDNSNPSYKHKVTNAENPSLYSPFSSKLEWEIAHWAKIRGPSSTAFNELMEIEGVSIIYCQLEAAH